MAFNKGHHVVFEREEIFWTHGQASILSDWGGRAGRECGNFVKLVGLPSRVKTFLEQGPDMWV